MHINELFALTEWVEKEIKSINLAGIYSNLFSVLDQNAKKQNNQPAQPFEQQKTDLLTALNGVNLYILSETQIASLDTMGILSNVGSEAASKVTELLSNTLDIAHVAAQVNAIQTELQQGVQKSDAIRAALTPITQQDEGDTETNKILTRITFHHDACINDIKELNEWSSKWFDIGRGFAMANGQTPEDVEIVGATKGSLILELAILASLALPIAKTINLTMDSLVKFQDFRIKSAEIRNMKAENENIAAELEEDAERWEARAIKVKEDAEIEITEKIKQHFDNYKEEANAELHKAVKTLIDFLSRGGDVDCVIPEEQEDEEEELGAETAETLKTLREDFKRIRELKEDLLIEHKPEE